MQNTQKTIDFYEAGEYYQYISFRKFRNSYLEDKVTKIGGKKKERTFIMRKFKKALSVALVTAMAFTSLTACSKSNNAGNGETSAAGGETETSKTAVADKPTLADYGSGTIKIWVADNVVDFTQTKCDEFFKANPDMAGYTVEIQATGEGDAAGNMVTDVQAGADIFGFAQDQLARLVAAGALMPLTGYYENFVSTNNDAGAVGASKVGNTVYAFPITSDNGYFLYYDKSVVTDPTSLDAIIADCEKAGKNFYMEINSGWYQTSFFFATGCKLEYTADDNGAFTASNITYASKEGVAALKAMVNLAKSSSFQNGSSVDKTTNLAAIVDGVWDSDAAKSVFGDNYACAKLPSFTVDGQSYQMSGFGGFKLLGVKPQEQQGKQLVCLALAEYLSNGDTQLARFNEVGWGPSNLVAQQSDAVKADAALSALAEQLAYTIPQGQYPGDYWTDATSLGDDVIADKFDNMSDDELMKVLEDFQALEQSYAK